MIDAKQPWELAKSLQTFDQATHRRTAQWQIAQQKATELRAQGFTVTVSPDSDGYPVITSTGGA